MSYPTSDAEMHGFLKHQLEQRRLPVAAVEESLGESATFGEAEEDSAHGSAAEAKLQRTQRAKDRRVSGCS